MATLDDIARELGIAPDSPERMSAAAVFTMNKETANGHVCLPLKLFTRAVAELANQPEDIAAAVSYLASEGAAFVTGQVLTCDGGFIHL